MLPVYGYTIRIKDEPSQLDTRTGPCLIRGSEEVYNSIHGRLSVYIRKRRRTSGSPVVVIRKFERSKLYRELEKVKVFSRKN